MSEQNYSYPPDDFDREADAAEHFGAHRAEEPFLQRNLVPLLIAAALLVIVIVTASFLLSGRGSEEPSSAPATSAQTDPAESGSGAGESPAAPEVDRSAVEVAVVNGAGISGLAGRWSDAVEAQDWQTGEVGNDGEDYDATTVVYSDPETEDHARALAAEFGISEVEESDEFGSPLTLVAKSEPPNGAESGSDEADTDESAE